MSLDDQLGRPLRSLRVSVTDRCNLRCQYCMPEENYAWLPREGLLSFEELSRLIHVFQSLGVSRVRLTGGEPLLRAELSALVAMLAPLGLEDIALTTNGVFLEEQAAALKAAGLQRVTVSLDTLRPERFKALTRRDGLDRVLAGIQAANLSGLTPLKLDAVIIRGANHDEVLPLLGFAKSVGAELRFIEYMDVGGATGWSAQSVVSSSEILGQIAAGLGRPAPLMDRGSAPAARYRLPDGTTFGIVASTTEPFCGACDRARLTADGIFFLCLYAPEGLDLREPLRSGASDVELGELIESQWRGREDRGAEARLALRLRRPSASHSELRHDPHLEMHTRGG